MKKTFNLTIELGNDAMCSIFDLELALQKVAKQIVSQERMFFGKQNITDRNGNAVGEWRLSK
jgi:hypothetical protein